METEFGFWTRTGVPASGSQTLLRSFSRAFRFMLLLTTAAILVPSSSDAQITTGDVVGTVKEVTGALIPGAPITLINLQTGETRSTVSNAGGDYAFNLLQIGTYSLRINEKGFETYEVKSFSLAVGDRLRLDATLAVGRSALTVQVNASEIPLLQTDSSAVGSTIEEQTVQNIPLNGRNFINLVQVQPGVNPGQQNAISSGNRPDDRRQTSTFSANGKSDTQNNNLIDGLDNNERLQGFIGVRAAIDGIEQIQVETNDYSAEVGRSAGAVVNVITKAGGNNFHGSVYEYFRNDIFDARDAFDNIPGSRKPEYRLNQFGGSLGGPVVHNKTFFFADAESYRLIQGQTYTTTVPTAFEEANPGNLSDLCPTIGLPPPCAQFPALPSFALNPVSLNYFKLFPAPNRSGFINNYTSTPNKTQFSTTVDGRVDHHFSPNDSVFVRYAYNPVSTFIPGVFPEVNGISPGGALLDYAGPSKTTSQNLQADYLHIFTPNLLLDLKAGFTRINIRSYPLNYGTNQAGSFGLTNANIPGNPTTSALTPMYFALGDYGSLGDGVYDPIFDVNNNFQLNGSVSYTRGTHNIKVGSALIRRQLDYFQSVYPTGAYLYLPLGVAALGDSSLAYFFTGTAYQYRRSNIIDPPGYRLWEPSGFILDNWRVSDMLTLNLGLRYEVFSPFVEAHNRQSNFDLSTLSIVTASSSNPTANVTTDHSDVSPRLGFAATLKHSTVIRGGFALSFYPTDTIAANPPNTFTYTKTIASPSTPAPIPTAIDPATFASNPQVTSVTAKSPKLRSLYIEQFNLMLQQEIAGNVFTVGYVGELGRQLVLQPNLDQPGPPGANKPALPFIYQTQLPYIIAIAAINNGGVNNYNALQTSYLLRARHGLTINANYTYARNMDDVGYSSFANGAGGSVYTVGLLPYDPAYDYGNSDLDVRHRAAITLNYQIPFATAMNGVRGILAKGWEVNALTFWQSGLPFTVVNDNDVVNIPNITADRPNIVGNPNLSNPSPKMWYKVSAFSAQTQGTLGNSGRNTVYGPRDRRVDLSVFKNLPLHGRLQLQFRAECFNITNTVNWGYPNVDYQTPLAGVVSNTATNEFPRQFQFALKTIF